MVMGRSRTFKARNYQIDVTADNMGPVIAAVKLFGGNVEKLPERVINDETGEIARITNQAAEIFLGYAKEFSPIWTGLLQRSHTQGDEERTKSATDLIIQRKVFIDPNVTKEHPHLGDIPSRYGPRYHRETLPWFDTAEDAAWPEFVDIVERGVDIFVQGALIL